MTRLLLLVAAGILCLLTIHCKKTGRPDTPAFTCTDKFPVSDKFLPAAAIQQLIDQYQKKGLPGITFMARRGDQYWYYGSGVANRENKQPVSSCLVWPGYSITKMYTATTVMRLVETGKINLDNSIDQYLPQTVVNKVPGADIITVRMLLNHSSGIENFWENPEFVAGYMQNPARSYEVNDYLQAAQERLFTPGTDVAYSNTNYLLLALIIDRVAAMEHHKAFEQYIYQPLSLTHTYYRTLPATAQNQLPQLYADIEGAGQLVNFTELSLVQFMNERGSNGIMATPRNFVDFLHGLTHSQLLSRPFFSQMREWKHGSDPAEVYGLGLEYYEYNGQQFWGHSGSSFGGRTLLLYNPATDISFFAGVNAGAELGGPVLEDLVDFMNQLGTLMVQ